MKFEIIGSRTDHEYGYGGYTGNKTDVDEVVATFDNKKDAELYIENSRLKNPSDKERPFRQKSLLANFEYAIIRETQPKSHLPHNPKI